MITKKAFIYYSLAISLLTGSAFAGPINLNAMTDFPTIGNGEAPYHKDITHRSLAINAANRDYQGKWARAETTFSGDSGTYNITITTLSELKGESTYRLLINGQEVGTLTNPKTAKDYKSFTHTWPKITIPAGAVISVQSIGHTNGKVKKRVGTAWSCGLWRGLSIAPAE